MQSPAEYKYKCLHTIFKYGHCSAVFLNKDECQVQSVDLCSVCHFRVMSPFIIYFIPWPLLTSLEFCDVVSHQESPQMNNAYFILVQGLAFFFQVLIIVGNIVHVFFKLWYKNNNACNIYICYIYSTYISTHKLFAHI